MNVLPNAVCNDIVLVNILFLASLCACFGLRHPERHLRSQGVGEDLVRPDTFQNDPT